MSDNAPFLISVHDPKPNLRELHLSFTTEFQHKSVDDRLEAMRAYVESLIQQAQSLQVTSEQRGVMTIIEICEQLLPHIQSDQLPLQETLIVEMGEGSEGSSLTDLLGQRTS